MLSKFEIVFNAFLVIEIDLIQAELGMSKLQYVWCNNWRKSCLLYKFFDYEDIFRCAVASPLEGRSVHRSVRCSVTPFINRLLGASYAEYSALL